MNYQDLQDQGLLIDSPLGPAVRVSLQYTANIRATSRQELRKKLHVHFSRIAESLETWKAGKLDMDSLSVMGQTVEASVLAERLPELARALREQGVRVDVLQEQKATL